MASDTLLLLNDVPSRRRLRAKSRVSCAARLSILPATTSLADADVVSTAAAFFISEYVTYKNRSASAYALV